MARWDYCSGTSRFARGGHLEELRPRHQGADHASRWSASAASPRPTRWCGRCKSGILDLIGAARPSIADPFLPKKIDEGRLDDIRECIGCNICVTGDMTGALSRCTQNPTFMEEWRKGWHPERSCAPRSREAQVLVVGAGPAGLSAARGLGLRGYEVALAEAGTELGGRVAQECRLPGLAAWGRVRDYRVGQIRQDAECRGLSRLDAGSRGRRAGVRLRRMSRSRPARPGGATAWRGFRPGPCRSTPRCRSSRRMT